jgi:alkylhydroperoxidase/carboxymuconolactone decarboxylase family protein YurZ
MLGHGGGVVAHEQSERDGRDESPWPRDAYPDDDWNFPFEPDLDAIAPGLHEAQNAWLAQIDSLRAPDRKTHELIRMVCTVIMRNPSGVTRHAMLAAEVGATWEEIVGSIVLTEPAFGILQVVEALPWARRGFERGTVEAKKGRKPA